MRFHLFGLAHFATTADVARCPFTALTYRMAKMLSAAGHEVIFYGAAGSDVSCHEFVEVVSAESLAAHTEGREANRFYPVWKTDSVWQEFAERGRKELVARYRFPDIALISFGNYQTFIPEVARIACEFCAGYSGIFAAHKVFPSYGWMHYLYGELRMQNCPAWYDVVIPHYLDISEFPKVGTCPPENHLLFVGRLNADKGLDIAVDVAKAAGRRLAVVGHLPAGEKPMPALSEKHVDFLGPKNPTERNRLMACALALLAPTRYTESFGLMAAEAMACGTPVISTDWGSFPEIVQDGLSGFRCRTLRDFVAAVDRAGELNRANCQRYAWETFGMEAIWPKYSRYFSTLETVHTDPKEWYSFSSNALCVQPGFTAPSAKPSFLERCA